MVCLNTIEEPADDAVVALANTKTLRVLYGNCVAGHTLRRCQNVHLMRQELNTGIVSHR